MCVKRITTNVSPHSEWGPKPRHADHATGFAILALELRLYTADAAGANLHRESTPHDDSLIVDLNEWKQVQVKFYV